MKKLVIIRGIPGSGKTTMAKEICDGIIKHPHFEADDFFTHSYLDEYNFSPELVKYAHQYCQLNTMKAMYEQHPKIVVSNTFTQIWELEPYLDMAKQFGYEVDIYVCDGEYPNVHGVPQEKVEEMKRRFEPTEDIKSNYISVLSKSTLQRLFEGCSDSA